MPTEYEASLIKIRRDTAQNWADRNPILSEGEIGIEWTDETRSTCYIKVGNGVTHYNDLNYFLGSELDGEKTPFLDFGLFNDDTLPTINGVKITGDLSLENLGIQPIGSYVTSESLVQGLALKADKTDIYTKDDMDGILNDLRVLPDYTGEDNKYLKIVGGIPTYVNLSEDVVSRDVLQEALDKKVDKAVGYTLVNENEYRGILQTLSEWEKYNIPDMRDDITNLENEIDAKVNTEELDNYLTKEEFQGTLDGYASKDELVKKANAADLTNHIHDHQNPHNVTLEQLGISEEYKKYPPLLLPVSEAVQAELNEKQDKFTVGFGLKMESGELSNTSPNIQSDWLAEEGQSDAAILNKPLLATVATTGSYNDLKDKPDLSQNVLKPAQKEVLGGIKLGEDFVLDEDDHLKYISGIVDYNDLKNKPSFKDIDGTIYPLIPEMTARDLNLASLTVAKAIDQRLQEEKADKVDLEALKEEVSKLPKAGEYYTKEEADEKFLTEYQDISGKADKATTLEGYGIQDAYNQIQIDNMLAEKADKGEIDGKQDKLTDEQLAAVNSGITAEKLEELENRTNTFTEEQMAAINSGVTFETVEQVSDNKTKIETLTERLDNISGEIGDGFVKAKVVSENERYTSEIIHEKGDYSNNLRLQYSYKNGDVDREYDDRTVLIQDSSNLTLHAYSYPQDAQYTSYSGIDVSPRGISLIGTTDINSEMRPYPEEETIKCWWIWCNVLFNIFRYLYGRNYVEW